LKGLVVVYSRTGRTLAVGEKIAARLGADIERIAEPRERRGIFGFVRSGYEALREKKPPIVEPKRDPSRYDIVIVGTPIWAGRMASPMRTYLSRFAGGFHRAAFFATSSSGRNDAALRGMARVAGVEPIAVMELAPRDLKEDVENRIERFIAEVEAESTANRLQDR